MAKAIDIYEGVDYRTMISYQDATFDELKQYTLESGYHRKYGLHVGGTLIWLSDKIRG